MNVFQLIASDFKVIKRNDPAAHNFLEILFCHWPFYTIMIYRFAHVWWAWKIPILPRFICQIAKIFTGVEIHPGAQIGKSFFIDHGNGIVIGETTIIGHHVSLYQGVTLGGTGKHLGKRHPTLGNYVKIGANAIVLGPIKIGNHAVIGGATVVLKNVPDYATVVGNPGEIVKINGLRV